MLDARPLPVIVETKETLDGQRKEFRCGLLESAPDRLVVLFVSEHAYEVHDLRLPAGTVTFGHFWRGRPYNAYHWLTSAGATIAYYFNLSDRTEITDGAVRWRDLVIDILVRPDGRHVVLDEHELPANLETPTRELIARARADLQARLDAVCVDLEARAPALWMAAFGVERL